MVSMRPACHSKPSYLCGNLWTSGWATTTSVSSLRVFHLLFRCTTVTSQSSPGRILLLRMLTSARIAKLRFRAIHKKAGPIIIALSPFVRTVQKLEMRQNQIEQVTEETLKSCFRLRELDLSHNRLHEQSIAHNTWTRHKYVRPSLHPSIHPSIQSMQRCMFCSFTVCHKMVY